ncbi:relaxase/mobilization nuclease domain-containing protein [Acinetobacter johnsonii]|uniref:relaxase/mobilization nuclease domain-containing protein n=1 Tax=Acinetobacter johnsonii TaxID=40214 RepID=UPI0021CD25F3|nr:relaxase/mobilization nuclease domain-containing protein [Acinetobacter johnsonii]MCU4328126.1 relaxase/mobilization nuclease domain-containing protein [Acinetobacter johnsonii]
MIVQFFNYGNGLSKGPLDYLLGKNRDREHAKILNGNEQEIAELIDSSPFAKKYTSGCLSFYESDFSEEAKKQVMAKFEQCLFPGMNENQYRVLWIEHKDKINEETGEQRLELNFLIPNVEITTGQRLQPYYHEADLPRVDLFKKITNFEYELHDPNDPSFRQAVTTKKNLPKAVKDIKSVIDIEAQKAVEAGLIADRASMTQWLTNLGLEITREIKSGISIKNPHNEEGRHIRLTGAIYEQDFRVGAESAELTRQASERYRQEAKQRNEGDIQRYRAHIERKSAELNDKYRHNTNEHTREAERIYSEDHTANRTEHPKNSISAQQAAGAVHSRSTSEISAVKQLEYRDSESLKDSRYHFSIEYSPDFNSLYSSYFRYCNERNQLREIHANSGQKSANSWPRQSYSIENERISRFIHPDLQHRTEAQIELTDEYASTVINDYRRSTEEARRCFEHYSKTEQDNRTARKLQQGIDGESNSIATISTKISSSIEQYSISRSISKAVESVGKCIGQSFEALDRLIRHQAVSVGRHQIIDRDAIQSIQRTIDHSAKEYTASGRRSSRTSSEANQTAINERARSSAEVSATFARFDTANISKALDLLDQRKELQRAQERKNDRGYDSPSPF